MKNSEQTLAQILLNQYEFAMRMLQENIADRDYFMGQRVAIMSIAASIFGKEITGQIPLEFVKNLEKIANNPSESFKHQIMDAFQSGVEFKRNMEITIGEEAEKYYKSLF